MSTLDKTLTVINQMQADRVIGRYAIGGAIAAFFYIEPAATYDLDIFVTFDVGSTGLITLSPIYDYLRGKGYEEQGETVEIEGWAVQFLPTINALHEEAIAEARQITFEDVPTWVLSAEHLMAIALQTGRPKDHARLIQFVENGVARETVLAQILARHKLEERWKTFQQRFLNS